MIQFRIQSTPNPNARKYVISDEIKANGKVSYKTVEECKHVPIASNILMTKGIKQIHLFENIITVTQDGSLDWSFVDTTVQQNVTDLFSTHDIFFEDFLDQETPIKKKELSGELKIIDEILERTIRPSLQMDGGDIEVKALDQDILTVSYMGACGDCPSSLTATLAAIQNVLRGEYSDNITVAVV